MLSKFVAVVLAAFVAIPIIKISVGIFNEFSVAHDAVTEIQETSKVMEEPYDVEITSTSLEEISEISDNDFEEESTKENYTFDEEPPIVEETSQEEESSDEDSFVYLGTYTLTAYCPCYECSEGYGNMTSSGKRAVEGRTVACNSLPAGTVLEIQGHTYVVEDTGGGLGSSTIDIFFDSHKETEIFGKQRAEVYLVQ